jgi:hypothetical protein
MWPTLAPQKSAPIKSFPAKVYCKQQLLGMKVASKVFTPVMLSKLLILSGFIGHCP